MYCQLEHANLSVHDIEETVRFLTIAFPHFRIRGEGMNGNGTRWVHVGADTTYLCLNEGPKDAKRRWCRDKDDTGVNHLGFAVDDAGAIRERLLAAGYKEGLVPQPHPHRKRVYVHDRDGVEWEFIEYFTEDPDKRNDYAK
ncbi:MAG: VOC family protein [Planctomycetota bacterium]|nr:VOC family protein [Planctomycetota bacterium]MDA1142987.1 VOC family protein [Planctomycetota bacterium]